MDQNPSKQPKDNYDYRPTRHQQPEDYEMYNETVTHQRAVAQKKFHYKKGPPMDKQISPHAQFQIPESDRLKFLPPYDSNFGRSPKESGKNLLENPSLINRYPNHPSMYDDPLRSDRHDYPKNTRGQSVEKETNQINYEPTTSTVKYHDPNSGVLPENRGHDIGKHSSLICKPINYDGEPVTVNDQVIRNKLILSCRPRRYYQTRKPEVEHDKGPGYSYPPSHPGYENKAVTKTTDIEYQQKIPGQPYIEQQPYTEPRPYTEKRPYTGSGKPSLTRSKAYDMGSLGLGEHGILGEKGTGEHISDAEKQVEKYEEQYRTLQCKRYQKNFKAFLWALLIINSLLVLIGLTLMLITLSHFLFRDYINIVIAHRGFSCFMWTTLALSLLIIIVGVYGIITSITRTKTMLITYCIMASVLALLIFIFLLVLWLLFNSLKTTEQSSMVSTFNLYRCHRWIRVAWDTLHEKFQCCGVEARGDWKYIPPSCCLAETKFQKLACNNHFIQEDQAMKGGCRTKLEDYFTSMFLVISCLLVLVFILLLLGILAALRLLRLYKIVLLCRDLYLITP